ETDQLTPIEAQLTGEACKEKLKLNKLKKQEATKKRTLNAEERKNHIISSQKEIETITGFGPKTIGAVFNGLCRVRNTVDKVCRALEISLDELLTNVNNHNFNYLGGYSRQQSASFIGNYITMRPNYQNNDRIYCYLTRITWDSSLSGLRFDEDRRNKPQY